MASQGFWHHFNQKEEDGETCLRAVRAEYAGHTVKEFEEQGYCSYTLLIAPLSGTAQSTAGYEDSAEKRREDVKKEEQIVQLRPACHALDLDIVLVASKTYPSLVLTITLLDTPLPAGLRAYTMNRLPGLPLSRLLPRTHILTTDEQVGLITLISSFADLIAQSWRCTSTAQAAPLPRAARADSPMQDTPAAMLSQCRGKVGATILDRLDKLAAHLPDAALRKRAKTTLLAVHQITDYPVVLTHGDLIPSNLLVDAHHWNVTGLVDWAEAEFLPWGTCLYALEHLLGYLAPATSNSGPKWIYFAAAPRLREVFWQRLFAAVPDLKAREDQVRTMRDVGVLLWHGIAWDGGAIDRVVSEACDGEEVVKLRAFPGAS